MNRGTSAVLKEHQWRDVLAAGAVEASNALQHRSFWCLRSSILEGENRDISSGLGDPLLTDLIKQAELANLDLQIAVARTMMNGRVSRRDGL